jgi:uncharacterized membrane-anchored protein
LGQLWKHFDAFWRISHGEKELQIDMYLVFRRTYLYAEQKWAPDRCKHMMWKEVAASTLFMLLHAFRSSTVTVLGCTLPGKVNQESSTIHLLQMG